jgi:DNA-binding XRE family transcriptional regulator
MEHHPTTTNKLWIARKKAALGQKVVARLLGHRSTSPVSEYETGRLLPSLRTALKLAFIYNTPIAELYPALAREIADEIDSTRRSLPSVRITRPIYDPTLTRNNEEDLSR